MDISILYKYLVPITQFNKGKASRLFTRAQKGETLIVIKNNTPVAVILSPEEYEILRTFPKVYNEAYEAKQEIDRNKIDALLTRLKTFERNGE